VSDRWGLGDAWKSIEYRKPDARAGENHSFPYGLDSELQNLLPPTRGWALDHGAGRGRNRSFVEGLGFRYIGIDLQPAPGIRVICDVTHLPFRDQVFDFVNSPFVFEHLKDPFTSCAEVFRVLKPRGIFLGAVGFLEPLHGGLGSYFHMTHLGLAELLRRSGFDHIRIWPLNDVFSEAFRKLFRHPKFFNRAFEIFGRLIFMWGRFLTVTGDWLEGLVKPGSRLPPIMYDLKFASEIAFLTQKPDAIRLSDADGSAILRTSRSSPRCPGAPPSG
jgi:SAM-dependent methyltransferase